VERNGLVWLLGEKEVEKGEEKGAEDVAALIPLGGRSGTVDLQGDELHHQDGGTHPQSHARRQKTGLGKMNGKTQE
jgi:hypothetical protein